MVLRQKTMLLVQNIAKQTNHINNFLAGFLFIKPFVLTPIRFIVFMLITVSAVAAHAQTMGTPVYSAERTGVSEGSPPDFFIAPLVEVMGYGRDRRPSFGTGFAIGAGNGVAIGTRFMYGIDTESVHVMELAVFVRFYVQGPEANTGPFFQLNAGAAIFGLEHAPATPAKAGVLSAGIAAGWRFPLGSASVRRWYIEPAVRAGYPYSIGAGVSFAFRL
jgi:hypothetical protein